MAGKNNKNKIPSKGTLIVKTVIAALIAFVLFIFSLTAIYGISEDFVDYGDDTAAMINNCNRSYYEKDYGYLRDSLTLWGLYSEDFDKYWEICDAYDLYIQCFEYAGLPNGKSRLNVLQAELGNMKQQCRFAENQGRLDQFYSEVMELSA